MMIEDVLKAMSAADAPPVRDLAFEIAVMARVERRRFHRALARTVALVLVTCFVLALVMPKLAPLWQAGFAAGSAMVGLPPGLLLGVVFMMAGLALPWWRRAG